VDVAEKDAVNVVLKTGQASVHHGHLFHASGLRSFCVFFGAHV
jgi:hypothetical protein